MANKWHSGILDRNWAREITQSSMLVPDLDYGIFELQRVGVPAKVLRRSGFEAKELRKGGYKTTDLLSAGYTQEEIYSR